MSGVTCDVDYLEKNEYCSDAEFKLYNDNIYKIYISGIKIDLVCYNKDEDFKIFKRANKEFLTFMNYLSKDLTETINDEKSFRCEIFSYFIEKYHDLGSSEEELSNDDDLFGDIL